MLLVIVVLTLDSFVTLGSALNIKRNKRNVDENGDDETFTETNADLPETTPIVFTDRLESCKFPHYPYKLAATRSSLCPSLPTLG